MKLIEFQIGPDLILRADRVGDKPAAHVVQFVLNIAGADVRVSDEAATALVAMSQAKSPALKP